MERPALTDLLKRDNPGLLAWRRQAREELQRNPGDTALQAVFDQTTSEVTTGPPPPGDCTRRAPAPWHAAKGDAGDDRATSPGTLPHANDAAHRPLQGAKAGIPKNIVTDGPVVTKMNADGMLWMQDQFLI